jgi:hypothetical protein
LVGGIASVPPLTTVPEILPRSFFVPAALKAPQAKLRL